MKIKIVLVMTLMLFVVLFTLQNTEVVNIKFFLWNYSLSRALLIFLLLAIGVLIGFFLGSLRKPEPDSPSKED